MSATNRPERKSMTVDMDFTINMDAEHIDMLRKEYINKIATELSREMREVMGPNWFFTDTGVAHQPGVYRFRIDVTMYNELVGGPYRVG